MTKLGLERWEDVAALVFAYLALLRTKGVPAHFIDECAKLADISWHFQVKISSVSCRYQGVVRSCVFILLNTDRGFVVLHAGWLAGSLARSLARWLSGRPAGSLDRWLERWIAVWIAGSLAGSLARWLALSLAR